MTDFDSVWLGKAMICPSLKMGAEVESQPLAVLWIFGELK